MEYQILGRGSPHFDNISFDEIRKCKIIVLPEDPKRSAPLIRCRGYLKTAYTHIAASKTELHFVDALKDAQQNEHCEKDPVPIRLNFFVLLGIDESEANSETFELLTLKDRLRASPLDIDDGKGFPILRGLDPARYSPKTTPSSFSEFRAILARNGQANRRREHLW